MTEQTARGPRHAIMRVLAEFSLPVLVLTLSVGFATQNWPASFITGLAISSTISALYWLDQRFLHPRLERLSRDWLHLGLEMTFSLLEHLLGALLALLVCARIFEKERQEERLKALATEAELKALKAQINPHFLFNTLNTIAELIHTDSERAEETVERLAEMFRYVLNGSERGLVPLEEELAFLDDYLQIERVRFGDRLRVTREIAPEALEVPVPSLLLQPLVENTVRHGQSTDGSIDLGINVQTEADRVVIAIGDHGPGMSAHPQIGEGPGHGLYNVDQRLRKTYGQEHSLEISANQPQGTLVTLRIPKEGQA
jgi:LytS/YehU family sensor histidine kinase